jgi:hypothetical protein
MQTFILIMSTYHYCSWIKDGQTLNVAGAGSGNGGGGNDLRLASVGRADRGWYRCLASNMAATRETDPVLLSVIGEIESIDHYRGPGFLAVVRFCSSPTSSTDPSARYISLSQSSCVSPVELTGKRRGGGGAKNHTAARKTGPI